MEFPRSTAGDGKADCGEAGLAGMPGVGALAEFLAVAGLVTGDCEADLCEEREVTAGKMSKPASTPMAPIAMECIFPLRSAVAVRARCLADNPARCTAVVGAVAIEVSGGWMIF